MKYISPGEARRLIGLVLPPRKGRTLGAPISKTYFYSHIRPELTLLEIAGVGYISLDELGRRFPLVCGLKCNYLEINRHE